MNATDTNPAASLPLNIWIALDSLTSEQLAALMEGPFQSEWNTVCKNSRESLELRITATEPTA
jgi:hypothetical protein